MKTVFILGAGFSVEAGAPMQESIMEEIFRIYSNNSEKYSEDDFILFKNLLTEQLCYKESQFKKIQLEDLFTPLDRCLADNINFRGLSLHEILKTRQAIFNIIGTTMRILLEENPNKKNYIDQFADFLVNESSKRINKKYRTFDPVSVISTNWDILLDTSIHNVIRHKHSGNAVVDYCCYISSLDEHDESVKPGLEKLGAGGFNVKLLKIHGSLNWLQCSRCMRLYAGFDQKIALRNYETCRHCNKNFHNNNSVNLLTSNLIMPTFIKDLSNPQYKIIWQNAGIELSEAEKIVFIGYSLPSADFEMRQLLSRMVRKEAKIEVVGFNSSDTQENRNIMKQKWADFFGMRDISVYLCGAKNYIETYMNKLTDESLDSSNTNKVYN
ncbi:hypothetical protein ACSN7N_001992 [Enterobacter hormaechei]|uniref:hypothetical protein n=1 Tax=Scandinavium sp. M-37 TaxID=3373077 RepID=UPI0037455DE5